LARHVRPTSPFTQAGSPVGSPALDLITAVLISAAPLVSVAAVVVRFVKSSGEERLQLKWCASAALSALMPGPLLCVS
jgi:hypothetical protein